MLFIPKCPGQPEGKPMKLIEFFSQQLQIAVDRRKSASHKKNGLDAVSTFLKDRNAEVPWLGDLKKESCYRDAPCAVQPEAGDTISRSVS